MPEALNLLFFVGILVLMWLVLLRPARKQQRAQQELIASLNVGDEVVAGPEHPIRVEDRDGVPRPYVHVRRGLEALIDRKSFYRLVAAAEPDADGRLVLRSQGAVFALEG